MNFVDRQLDEEISVVVRGQDNIEENGKQALEEARKAGSLW